VNPGKPLKCPLCNKSTGHLQTTYAHQTSTPQGGLVTVGRGYCSEDCATKAGAAWRKANVPTKMTVRDAQHGGKVTLA
jgi:hypothetical protein